MSLTRTADRSHVTTHTTPVDGTSGAGPSRNAIGRQLEKSKLGRGLLARKDKIFGSTPTRATVSAHVPTKVEVKDAPIDGMMLVLLGGMGTAAGLDAGDKHLKMDQEAAGKLVNDGLKDKVMDQDVNDMMLVSLSSQVKDRTAYLLKHVYNERPDGSGGLRKPTQDEIEAALIDTSNPENPWPGILKSVKMAVAGANAVGKNAALFMVCNTAHGWYGPIQNYLKDNAPGSEIYHIADGVFAALGRDPELKKQAVIKIGLQATSGTQQTGIYQNRLAQLKAAGNFAQKFGFTNPDVDVQFVVPDPAIQEQYGMGAIYGIGQKESDKLLNEHGLTVPPDTQTGGIKGGQMEIGRERSLVVANHLKNDKEAAAVSLSCTEYPLVMGEAEEAQVGLPLIDATASGVRYTKDEVEKANVAASTTDN